MSNPNEKPNHLSVWGDSMTNKLPSVSRKRRKREASKKRREIQRQEICQRQGDDTR